MCSDLLLWCLFLLSLSLSEKIGLQTKALNAYILMVSVVFTEESSFSCKQNLRDHSFSFSCSVDMETQRNSQCFLVFGPESAICILEVSGEGWRMLKMVIFIQDTNITWTVLYRRGRLCLSTSCVACGRVELRRHFVKKTAVVAMCVLFVVKYRVRTGAWVEVDDKRLEKRVRSIFLRRFSSN